MAANAGGTPKWRIASRRKPKKPIADTAAITTMKAVKASRPRPRSAASAAPSRKNASV